MFLEDHEIDFPDPLDAATRRRSIHRFADQSVRLSLGSAFASPACFFQIDHRRDHAQVEAGGGCARLPIDAFSCPIFNRLRNFGDIEQSGIIRAAFWCGPPAWPLAYSGALDAVWVVGLPGPCGRWPQPPPPLSPPRRRYETGRFDAAPSQKPP